MHTGPVPHHRTVDDVKLGPVENVLREEFDAVEFDCTGLGGNDIFRTVVAEDGEIPETALRIIAEKGVVKGLTVFAGEEEDRRALLPWR